MVTYMRSKKKPFTVQEVENTLNPFSILGLTWGRFRIISVLMIFLPLYSIIDTCMLFKEICKARHKGASAKINIYCAMNLILISSVLRIIVFYDCMGVSIACFNL